MTGLWDCWDDDAIPANRATGQFIDWSKVRTIDHKGAFFSVKGPLNVGRCPQGRPIIIQAGGSERGQELAARTADVIFSVVQDFGEAKAAYAAFKARLARYGRSPGEVSVLPGVMPIVGRTDAEAREKLDLCRALSTTATASVCFQTVWVTTFPATLPDTSHGFARALLGRAKRERMTLRDLYNLTVAARGHMVLCGSPLTIVDTLQHWFEEGAADGFNIMPAYFPGAFDEFVDLVVPELQRRRLFRSDYAGATLRDHLGLSRPDPWRRAGQPMAAK